MNKWMNFTWNLSHLIPLISSPRVDFHLVKGGILYHCGTHMVVPWDEFHLLSEDFSEHFSDKFSSTYRILFAMLSNTWSRFLKPLKYKIYSKEAKKNTLPPVGPSLHPPQPVISSCPHCHPHPHHHHPCPCPHHHPHHRPCHCHSIVIVGNLLFNT